MARGQGNKRAESPSWLGRLGWRLTAALAFFVAVGGSLCLGLLTSVRRFGFPTDIGSPKPSRLWLGSFPARIGYAYARRSLTQPTAPNASCSPTPPNNRPAMARPDGRFFPCPLPWPFCALTGAPAFQGHGSRDARLISARVSPMKPLALSISVMS